MGRPLDRDAVDRVLARAHRLESVDGDVRDGIEPQALIEAATEVGIDPNAVRDSLAIERFTISARPRRRLDRLAGPAHLVIERDVPLTVEQTISGLQAWLTSPYRMLCDRRGTGVLVAHRRSDPTARLGRVLSAPRGDGRLAASQITVEAVAQIVGSSPARPRTLVRISADRSTPRQLRLAGAGSLAAVGFSGGAVAAAAEAFVAIPIVAIPLAVGGYVVASSGRGHADRLALELDHLLTRVERGEQPVGLLGRVASRARRAARRTR